jgi:hypothetical protein
MESKISGFLGAKLRLFAPKCAARMDRDRSKRGWGGGRAKKTAKQRAQIVQGVLDALGHLFHGGLLFV